MLSSFAPALAFAGFAIGGPLLPLRVPLPLRRRLFRSVQNGRRSASLLDDACEGSIDQESRKAMEDEGGDRSAGREAPAAFAEGALAPQLPRPGQPLRRRAHPPNMAAARRENT